MHRLSLISIASIFPYPAPIRNRKKRHYEWTKETRPSTGLFDCRRVEIIQVISEDYRFRSHLDPADSPVSTRSVLTRAAFKRQFVRLINRVHTSGPCVTGVLRVYARTHAHARSPRSDSIISCSGDPLVMPRRPNLSITSAFRDRRRRFVHVHTVFLRRLLT